MTLSVTEFTTATELDNKFAVDVASLLSQAIADRGQASLVVSGGSTPLGLFTVLSQQDIAWDKVVITLADERWVSPDNEASNERLVREKLLINRAASAVFIGLKTEHTNADEALETCAKRLDVVSRPFDVLILGMGGDGHTASLFPCSEQIQEGVDLARVCPVIAVQPTTAPHQRMSLSLNSLLNSRNIFLHITGDAKRAVLNTAVAQKEDHILPIGAVVRHADVSLIWAP